MNHSDFSGFYIFDQFLFYWNVLTAEGAENTESRG